MPTQIPPTPDDATEIAYYPCAHAFGAAPTRTWLYKAESKPETAITCPRTAELRVTNERGRFVSGHEVFHERQAIVADRVEALDDEYERHEREEVQAYRH
jgi:hypothetical protein